jgi:hypothetical protein
MIAIVALLGVSTPGCSLQTSSIEFEMTAGAAEPNPQEPANSAPKPQEPAKPETKPQEPSKPEAKPQEPAKAGTAKPETTFKPEQLEQIVAPIALHPDSLLAQILMASTYPLEIVEAYRWLEKNPKLKAGPELEEALKKQDWDASVKALCGLRDVVKQMNDNLDWTQDLGDAFLGQKTELMETVQKMRKKALDSGNLKTSEQVKVTQDSEVIVIEQTKTEVVYVPSYSPTVVYGPTWSYPYYYYPPMYVPPPAGYGFMAFTAGVFWGAAIWGGCNWHGNDVNINVNNFNNFNRNTNINGGRDNLPGSGNSSFKHDASHRKGVNYKSPHTAQQFGGTAGQNRVTKDQARGFDRSGTSAGNRAGTSAPRAGTQPGGASRPGTQPAGGASRPSTSNPSASRPSTSKPSTSNKSGSSALSGSRNPSADRSASSRGAASRASSGGGRSGGGGGRSGGGGGRGGGGRR